METKTSEQSATKPARKYKDLGWRDRNLVFPDDGPLHDSWRTPLEAVTRVVTGNPRFPFYDPDDFMIMCRVLRGPRPSLVLYKHYYTRRYLNLDDTGHTYRYVPPKDLYNSRHDGRYLAHKDFLTAMDHLELWHLPWLKPGLEAARRDLDYEDAWQLHPRFVDGAA